MKKIREKKQTEKRHKKLWKLCQQWTRAETMARHMFCPKDSLEYCDYAVRARQLEDKIRKLLFGTSNLVKIGKLLKFPMDGPKKKKKKKGKKKR